MGKELCRKYFDIKCLIDREAKNLACIIEITTLCLYKAQTTDNFTLIFKFQCNGNQSFSS